MTIRIPTDDDLAGPTSLQGNEVMVTFAGRGGDDTPRDTTKPLCKDAKGLLYAPAGITFTLDR